MLRPHLPRTDFYTVFRTFKFKFGVICFMGNGKAPLVSRRGTIFKILLTYLIDFVLGLLASVVVNLNSNECFLRRWCKTVVLIRTHADPDYL